jgi:thiosulfate reductase/polysulfide reductase chain A
MALPNPKLTRRTFLRSSLAGAAALALPSDVFRTPRPRPPAKPWRLRGPVVTTYNYCDMCPWRCGIVVRSVNGKVVKIDGNPADPKSRGMLCARGQGGVSFLNDPDRLTKPLIRTGPRGTWQFREANWDEALGLIAEKMTTIKDQYGQEAVAFIGHTSGDFWFTDHLAQAWGSPNAAKPSMSLCTSPREEAALLTFGRSIGNHEPVDWEQIRAVAFIGGHVGEDARNTLMQDFSNAAARGAELIVVDPRFSTAAMKATHWLPIKPGTDTALLLAWINVLISENLYDKDYVDTWATGFAELADHVRDNTPEWAAAITDLPAEAIRESARALGNARPQAAIMPGRHVVWYGNDTQRMRAVYIVNALLGAYGRPGGLYFSKLPYIEEYPHAPYAVVGGAGG